MRDRLYLLGAALLVIALPIVVWALYATRAVVTLNAPLPVEVEIINTPATTSLVFRVRGEFTGTLIPQCHAIAEDIWVTMPVFFAPLPKDGPNVSLILPEMVAAITRPGDAAYSEDMALNGCDRVRIHVAALTSGEPSIEMIPAGEWIEGKCYGTDEKPCE